MKTVTTYIAKDYIEFDDEQECKEYEKFLDLTKDLYKKEFFINEFCCERTVFIINEGPGFYKQTPFEKHLALDGRDIYQAISKLLKPRDFVKYSWDCKKHLASDGKTTVFDIYIEYDIQKPCYLIETSMGKDLRFPCKPEDLKDIEEYAEKCKKKYPERKLFEIKPCKCSFANIVLTYLDKNVNKDTHLIMNRHPSYEGEWSLVDNNGNPIYI